MYLQQNVRMSQHAALNDGQADWLDVQTLYASGRFANQPRPSPSVIRDGECFYFLLLLLFCIYLLQSSLSI